MNHSVVVLTLAAAVVAATPILLAGLGELLSERSGVLNLGVEGIMLIGAVAGFATVQATSSPWLALLVAMVAGAAFTLIHAFITVTLGLNQIVSGLALVILGGGVSSFVGSVGSNPLVGQPAKASFRPWDLGALDRLPIVGPIVVHQDPVVYLSWLSVAAVFVYLTRTRMGLRLRAVGDSPETADAMGISVARYRYGHVLAGGALGGAAGAHITVATNPSWVEGITAGQGWIAVALVVFAGWRPFSLLAGAYLFGLLARLGFAFQAADVKVAAPQILSMIPFIAAALLLVLLSSRRARLRRGAPLALGQPFDRESREQG